MSREISICEYIKNPPETGILIDLREKEIYQFGSIRDAINIPLSDIKQLYELPKERDIYVFCQGGELSGEIAELLSDAGYNAYNLTGGYREYLRYTFSNTDE
ncbi:MAG: rhodanese-like domain-containing protein [Oscillospiraceae bacterium]|nr:rhodanese-like domain-containing protein [Oscillospiraceae bacterium]